MDLPALIPKIGCGVRYRQLCGSVQEPGGGYFLGVLVDFGGLGVLLAFLGGFVGWGGLVGCLGGFVGWRGAVVGRAVDVISSRGTSVRCVGVLMK